MRADIAESIRHDVVTDDQYILEAAPFNGERWAMPPWWYTGTRFPTPRRP